MAFCLIGGLLCGPAVIWAAPFIVCDPYPSTGAQPTYFVVVPDGGAAVSSPPLTQTDGGKILHYDLASIANGQHNYTVAACDTWGCTAAVPFSFTKGVLSAPSGLRLSNQ